MLRWIYIASSFGILMLLGLNDYLITSDVFSFFPDSILFFIDLFMIPDGLNIIISSYILRFLIKRLHLIS